MRNAKILDRIPKTAHYAVMNSPVGELTLLTSAAGLHAILWDNDAEHFSSKEIIATSYQPANDEISRKTQKQLLEYFQGQRQNFDLPLVLNGTDFQIKAWQQLLEIPYGETVSYAEQAAKISNRNKARAVGMANGLNPISIVVPCHRVIGSNGDLVGFGGGLEKKAYLLNLERQYAGK